MVRTLRVAYMGTPQFAVPTLRALLISRHMVCGVITQPDRPRGRGQQVSFAPVKAVALDHGLAVFQPERLGTPEVEATLRAWRPDLGVVAAYGKIIPESLIQVPRFGMINVHASLLPRLRGAAPIHRSVIAGDVETGVTIMRVVKALDAGATFAKVTRAIGPDETSDAIERDLADLGANLLVSVVDQIASGTSREEPQDDTLATYAARLTKEEGLIDWSLSAVAIHNRVRGLYPWPHAYTYLGNRRLILLTTKIGSESGDAKPGTIVAITSDGVEVATGQGRVIVEDVQPEGRRPMRAHAFIAGHRVQPGERFSAAPAPPAGHRYSS